MEVEIPGEKLSPNFTGLSPAYKALTREKMKLNIKSREGEEMGEIIRFGVIGTENSHVNEACNRFNLEKSISGAVIEALYPGEGDTLEHAKEVQKEGKVPLLGNETILLLPAIWIKFHLIVLICFLIHSPARNPYTEKP